MKQMKRSQMLVVRFGVKISISSFIFNLAQAGKSPAFGTRGCQGRVRVTSVCLECCQHSWHVEGRDLERKHDRSRVL